MEVEVISDKIVCEKNLDKDKGWGGERERARKGGRVAVYAGNLQTLSYVRGA